MSRQPFMGSRLARHVAAMLVAVQFSGVTARAFDLSLARDQGPQPATTSEFIYRSGTDDSLISVYLLGAVAKPGLYHVPVNTDLISLLTLAGGATQNAETDEILIKGQNPGASRREIHFDLEKSMRDGGTGKVMLASNDLVYVTPAKPALTTQALTYIGLVSSILAIVATGLIINDRVK